MRERKRYSVTRSITQTYSAIIEADSLEEAEEISKYAYSGDMQREQGDCQFDSHLMGDGEDYDLPVLIQIEGIDYGVKE